MFSLEYRTEIHCKPELLWEWITDPNKQKQWAQGLLEVTPPERATLRAGTQYSMKIKEGNHIAHYDVEVVQSEKHRRLNLRISGETLRGGTMYTDYELSPKNGTTVLDYRYSVEMSNVGFAMKLFMPLIKAFNNRQTKQFMSNLKRLVEQQASS